jgi:hypothetical protein
MVPAAPTGGMFPLLLCLLACTPVEPSAPGAGLEVARTEAHGRGEVGLTVQEATAQEPPPPPDPFEGWSEERIEAWRQERQARTRKVFARSLGTLEQAAKAYDEHDELPESSLLFDDQESNQQRIDRLLDRAIEALELSGLEDVRRELRAHENEIAALSQRLSRDREARIAAPRRDEINAVEDAYTTTVEEYDARIAQTEQLLDERRAQIDERTQRFVEELRAIGVELDRETAESLLASVTGDDFVQLCVVFDNVRLVTEQLQQLTEQSGERLEVARRYYGVYVVLIRIMDRLQRDFVSAVRDVQVPRLRELAGRARENILQAERNLRSGGDPVIGSANIGANELTIQATGLYTQYLLEQATDIERQNRDLQVRLRDAINTYDTVRVSSQVAEILKESARNLDALLNLEVPRLRGFENRELQEEFGRLTEQLTELQ